MMASKKRCNHHGFGAAHSWLTQPPPWVVAAASSAITIAIITRHLRSSTGQAAPPSKPETAQASNRLAAHAQRHPAAEVDAPAASAVPNGTAPESDSKNSDRQARRLIIERAQREAPHLCNLPYPWLHEVAEHIEKQAPGDGTLRKQVRRAQMGRISNALLLIATLLTTVLPVVLTTWVVITIVRTGTFTMSLPQRWPVLGLKSEMAVTALSALFAANAAINVALAVSGLSIRRPDQIYDTLWRTDLTRVAGAAAFAAVSTLLIFLVGGSDRNPATVFLMLVLAVLTIALAITCDQRENTITRTERFHSARNTLSGLIVWREHLRARHVPTAYHGLGQPPKEDRYRTWYVLLAITAMALICMCLFAVIAMHTRPALAVLVILCLGAVLSLGATWSFLFQTQLRWTNVTDDPERSLDRIPLLEKVFVTGLTVCALLLASFPDGRIAATIVIGIVVGPVILFRAISLSLKPGHSRVVDFLAWPVWGRVETELERKQDVLTQSASHRFIQELSWIEPTPAGQRTLSSTAHTRHA
ncbi:Uncharacterised protein [Mycobacteroides abscessus subsp. abscessus]|nr:Uncharacterised protein [Mycobacteroides abscessus subsp. abscessus]SHY16223.1 Uncharacterised protein [Mycobacteroides abscessus subsp. abscessus]SIB55459.1 Uncharacterised protein [Mycobacteroides abscessus subsp. abscessus]SIB94991.1 Uncharacterised protein [Mycobacteroides abscessus subsp. abscessus]SIC80412.1 Uncharacterised protein [Mycobacteroides abscessus subsp. abscessus]